MSDHDENLISPELRRYLARLQDDVRRVEAFEALFTRSGARLPHPDEDVE